MQKGDWEMEIQTTGVNRIAETTERVLGQLKFAVLGSSLNLRLLWANLLTGGHVLLEGVPGLGKTLMVRSLAKTVDAAFARIQFTPDLMPADVTGTKVYDPQSGRFSFKRGPVFTHLLLADEINRTPPKTQAALLEAMEEGQVSIDGESIPLPSPFFVVATQNPLEYEGTYPLPEAQLDRFSVKLIVDYPGEEEEVALLREHRLSAGREARLEKVVGAEELLALREEVDRIIVEESVLRYIASIIRNTRQDPRIALGGSPRAGLSLLTLSRALAAMDGRHFVTPDDVKTVVKPVLRHRILLTPEAELEGMKTDDVIEEIVRSIQVPR
ncbi:MoxR-like ATPase [Planifilum fulgidum]|jgi:MoxR-like ATPase|uniref:MoxR-like ATPase n=2 Tax=Planifilum fulgidum TaxID=201973 RepID=A0A1I2PBW8_9BACL|nr:MoxR-like ATPase [Planifilum fulgidum]